jgi:predicted DCC family thiol-disulfide oxidoreductase YuxK
MAAPPPLLVAFDGGCPLCRREIGHYQGLQPLQPLVFVDLNTDALPADAPPRPALAARLHARTPQGQWVQGAAAFVALWSRLPGWRWLARAARLPGALPLLDAAYAGFLRVRPLWRRPPACAPR